VIFILGLAVFWEDIHRSCTLPFRTASLEKYPSYIFPALKRTRAVSAPSSN
jgi:hypothetical protein